MRFTRQTYNNNSSLCITIPAELVKLYKIYNGDYVEFELVRNHRDKAKDKNER